MTWQQATATVKGIGCVHTWCVQDPLGFIILKFALQCHLLASCGVKILEVSAVAVYNFKAQASLHLICFILVRHTNNIKKITQFRPV
jgi:hypothetical protein